MFTILQVSVKNKSVSSDDGRHVVMMPHLERSIFPWNWAHYPADRKSDLISPWIQAFEDAHKWFYASN